jgi:hypothetical protein
MYCSPALHTIAHRHKGNSEGVDKVQEINNELPSTIQNNPRRAILGGLSFSRQETIARRCTPFIAITGCCTFPKKTRVCNKCAMTKKGIKPFEPNPLFLLMVPKAGIEPARVAPLDFESSASTNFTTPARRTLYFLLGPPVNLF